MTNSIGANVKEMTNSLGANVKDITNSLGVNVKDITNSFGSNVKEMLKNPVTGQSNWFSSVANTFEDYFGSYLLNVVLICAVGFFHNFYLLKNSPDEQLNGPTTKRLLRRYGNIAQMAISGISFMTVIAHPHFQQLISTSLIFLWNMIQMNPQVSATISQGVTQAKEFVEKHLQKKQPEMDDEKTDFKQKEMPAEEPKVLQRDARAASPDSGAIPDAQVITRLALNWAKTAIFSYGGALPVLLANNTHISRKKSWLSFLSFLSSNDSDYFFLNPFSLSLLNWVGVAAACFALYFSLGKVRSGPMSKRVPSWYDSLCNYSVFSTGLFLTSFALGRPFTWISAITPLISIAFSCIRLIHVHQQRKAPMPSFLKKIEQSQYAKNVLNMGEKFLPGVLV